MPTRYFDALPDCFDYFSELVDSGLDDYQELRYWRTDSRYAVMCVPLGRYWALDERSDSPIPDRGIDESGQQSSDSSPLPKPAVIVRGSPKKKRRKPTREALEVRDIGFSASDPVIIDVVLDAQYYGRDQASASVEADSTGYFAATVTLQLEGLPDAQWARLVAAARQRDVITLSVRVITGIHGRPSRSHVRVDQIVNIRPVGQIPLPSV